MVKRKKNHIFTKKKNTIFPSFSLPKKFLLLYRILLASRSDSKRVKISPCRTGPLTFRVMVRLSSTNSTRTWVHWPWEPVRPTMEMTLAYRGWLALSMVVFFWMWFFRVLVNFFWKRKRKNSGYFWVILESWTDYITNLHPSQYTHTANTYKKYSAPHPPTSSESPSSHNTQKSTYYTHTPYNSTPSP